MSFSKHASGIITVLQHHLQLMLTNTNYSTYLKRDSLDGNESHDYKCGYRRSEIRNNFRPRFPSPLSELCLCWFPIPKHQQIYLTIVK